MPRLTGTFTPEDIRLDVILGLGQTDAITLLAAGQPVPAWVVVTAILDTGANVTAVAPWVTRHFGLTSRQQRQNTTASGVVTVDLFRMGVGLPPSGGRTLPDVLHPDLLVSELAVPPKNADMLLGLDVLLNCMLLVDGPAKTFTLDF